MMMFLIGDSTIKNVATVEIDFNNIDYKLSRDFIGDKLINSINSNGILEPPVLLREDNSYIIIAGHNRLQSLNQHENKYIESFVIKRIEHEYFIRYAILKNYRREVGPIGKIRFINILKEIFRLDNNEIINAAKDLQMPVEIINTKDPWYRISDLPGSLKAYIDSKDINFKNIKSILRLPGEAVYLLSDWIKDGMRVNIFKGIVELIHDIFKRDKSLAGIENIDLNTMNDRRQREEFLYKEIFKVRYPEYSNIRSKADAIIKKINASGLDVYFPEYFEGDEIGISVKINKRENAEFFHEKINTIDKYLLKDLLELL